VALPPPKGPKDAALENAMSRAALVRSARAGEEVARRKEIPDHGSRELSHDYGMVAKVSRLIRESGEHQTWRASEEPCLRERHQGRRHLQ
jgi:hypothetical protein